MRAVLFLFIISVAWANLGAQDSIVAENIFRHEIRDGARTVFKKITEQKTFNNEGKLVLQLLYSDTDTATLVRSYTFFFYDDDLLIGKDTYHGENLIDSAERYILPTNASWSRNIMLP